MSRSDWSWRALRNALNRWPRRISRKLFSWREGVWSASTDNQNFTNQPHSQTTSREPFLTMLGPFTSPSGLSWDQTQQIQLLRKESPMAILPRCNHQQNCSGYGRSWPKKTTLTNWKSILVHIIWPCDIWGSWIWERRDWGVFFRGTNRTSLSLRSALFLCLELNASHGNSWGLWTRRTPLPQQLPSSRDSVRFPPPSLTCNST